MAREQQSISAAPNRYGSAVLWRLQVPIGATLAAVGAAMIVLAFSGSLGVGRQIFECVLGAAVLAPGGLFLWAALAGKRSTGLHLAAGETALAATIVYLGEAMPPFHHGAVGHDAGLAQFIAVIVGLVVGAISLALPAPASSEKPTGIHWASVIRDSVILIVGTIVVAIGISQTANPAVMPPKWNWTSFLGITIPGMLTLIFLRGGLKAIGRRGQLLRAVAVEGLLVVGLGVMILGSVTNLNLGASGYQVGMQGNASGLTLWIAAALFLVVVRGAFKLAVPDGDHRTAVALARKALYVIGVIAFIYGEKSVIIGKLPAVAAGGAFAAAATIVIAGVLVVTCARQAAKAMEPTVATAGAAPRGVSTPASSSPLVA
ncbi:MAG: hypothetical protein ACR2LV_06555 [Solirubrobacteraceae bacterium]